MYIPITYISTYTSIYTSYDGYQLEGVPENSKCLLGISFFTN